MTTTEQPADTIRRAAAHLRALAAAASTPPWTVRPRWADDPDGSATVTSGDGGPLVHGNTGTRGRPPFLIGADARYVTALDPAVGLALADLLDAQADAGDVLVVGLAHRILGEAP
ncbi:hypothetical protein [Embleya sp. NPDC020630]|uniref:hypothetical protein n=1 Tax=Embleya sp. NPDC020630 TaxID=3363979 RepID=UPI0037975CE8